MKTLSAKFPSLGVKQLNSSRCEGCLTNRLNFYSQLKGELKMLNYSLLFLVLALVAAMFGFTGVAVAAAGVAKILFILFLVLFLASLVMHSVRRV